jgi:hypothetical protein
MDWLLNTVPLLPADALLRLARPLMWAVVMAAVAAAVAAAVPDSVPASVASPRVARWVAALAAACCLLPAPWSLAYHLSLAFMLPSWSTVLLCAWCLWRQLFATESGAACGQPYSKNGSFGLENPKAQGFDRLACAGAVVGGALLLADTFIQLPAALYAWGFGTAAVAALALAAAALWALSKPGSPARLGASVLAGALALHVATRLPSGNVFDAVLDPLLWAVLLWTLLTRGWVTLKLDQK